MDSCLRRVIENKLNGKSVRAWFEDPNLVHFIQKDYFSCTTQPLSDFKSSHNDIPLVWYEQHHLGKIEHLIFASLGELLKESTMFTKIRKLSTEHIREMPAWGWNSILSYEVAGETFVAETFIYFTQEGYQHAYGNNSVPIRIRMDYSQTKSVTLDIFGFNNEVDDSGFFHIPDGVLCQTAATTKMPKIIDAGRVDQFCLKSEFFNLKKYDDENENAPFYMNLWLDEEVKLAKYEFSTHGEKDLEHKFGKTTLNLIHDMTDDKLFVQDIPKGNCSIMTLFDWADKFSHIHGIHPALEIIHDPVAYYDASETAFSLVRSQKLERGFDVDDWIFERDTFPFSSPQKTTFQWSWTNRGWLVYEGENQEWKPQNPGTNPARLKIRSKDNSHIRIEQNIYFYAPGPKAIPVDLLDVSNCYELTNKQYLQFNLTASHDSKKNIKKYQTEFEKELHRKLALSAKSNYYRIVNIKTFSDHHAEEIDICSILFARS